MKNPFIRRSRISKEVTLKLFSGFAHDWTAAETARQIPLNLRTVKFHFNNIRRKIQAFYKEQTNEIFNELGINTGILMNNNTEAAYSKKQLKNFRILALTFIHEDGIYLQTEIVCSESIKVYKGLEQQLLALIPKHIEGFGFADLKFQKLPDVSELSKLPELTYLSAGSERNTTKMTVGNFWEYANDRRKQFRSIDPQTAYYHLREAEWRFNCDEARLRNNDFSQFNADYTFQRPDPTQLFKELLHIVRNDPI